MPWTPTSLDIYKLVLIGSLFVVALVAGLIPLRFVANKYLLSLGNCLAAGVFLAAGLLHMLPDSIEELNNVGLLSDEYPYGELFCAGGFFLVLVLEKVLLPGHDAVILSIEGEGAKQVLETVRGGLSIDNPEFKERQKKHQLERGMSSSRGSSAEQLPPLPPPPPPEPQSSWRRLASAATSWRGLSGSSSSTGGSVHTPLLGVTDSDVAARDTEHVELPNYDELRRVRSSTVRLQEVQRVKYYSRLYAEGVMKGMSISRRLRANQHHQQHLADHDHLSSSADRLSRRRKSKSINMQSSDEQQPELRHSPVVSVHDDLVDRAGVVETGGDWDDDSAATSDTASDSDLDDDTMAVAEKRSGFNVMPYILLIVLSLHAFVAGLAVGLTGDNTAVLATGAAVIAHKLTAALALGISLIKGGVNKSLFWKLIVLFSVTTPLGVTLGLVLNKAIRSHAMDVFKASTMAVGSGTFVYIAAVVNLPEEFEGGSRIDKLFKLFAVLVGFSIMAVVAIVT